MKNINFIPKKCNFDDIFMCENNKNKRYKFKIPKYQRKYSWKDEQLEKMIDSIEKAIDEKESLFLGFITLSSEHNKTLNIIDGQQRITTIMILLFVILKDYKDKISKKTYDRIENYLYIDKREFVLRIEPDDSYSIKFKNEIIDRETFNLEEKVSDDELKKDDPTPKYKNTAYFFYKYIKEELLEKNKLEDFIEYIFNYIYVIRTICDDENYAIKMFQSLNGTGLDLTNWDLFYSWLYSKSHNNDSVVNTKNKLEEASNDINITMDDFLVYFEYSVLTSNPKLSVYEELEKYFAKMNYMEILSKMQNFMNQIVSIYKSKDSKIYSLRYIPWKFYVITCVAILLQGKYKEKEKDNLLESIKNFYYIALISGANINTVKQSSFDLMKDLSLGKSIDEIEEKILNDFIERNNRIKKVYENLEGQVYGERFIKPLMLSLEYEIFENGKLSFINIDEELHLDHILPKKYYKNRKGDWNYIDENQATPEVLNSIGNMALLKSEKNIKGSNLGYLEKINIYKGLNPDGTEVNEEKYGKLTPFESTKEIYEKYAKSKWNVDDIKRRKKDLIEKTEKFLKISRDQIDINKDNQIDKSNATWKYNNVLYNSNSSFVKNVLNDYFKKNNIRRFDQIPRELVKCRLYCCDLVKEYENDSANFNKYEFDTIKLQLTRAMQSPKMDNFVEIMTKLDKDFKCEKIENRRFIDLIENYLSQKNSNYKYYTDQKGSRFIQFYKNNWDNKLIHFEVFNDKGFKKNETNIFRVELHVENYNNKKLLDILEKNHIGLKDNITKFALIAIINNEVLSYEYNFKIEEESIDNFIEFINDKIENLMKKYSKIIDKVIEELKK